MLGEFDLEDFQGSGDKNVMAFLFIVMMFFLDIIMLNLLIAIMADEYERVQAWGHEQYLYAKAGIIIEYVGAGWGRNFLPPTKSRTLLPAAPCLSS